MDEWILLLSIAGGNGGKLKEKGFDHWQQPNSEATNELSFNALPGGYRDGLGVCTKINTTGVWWTKNQFSIQKARYFVLRSSSGCGNIFDAGMNCGMSVRCIKD